ncbi:PQQ-dependent catabolism-associated CXXCW motif protein [Microvirga sp. TS319]|uniref:PQQ-dependent catabolism-associated CXXCW motif protein n=1 Tax=Microvirga sp. TS319 TaxID=3241165 RepID=UPI003519F352
MRHPHGTAWTFGLGVLAWILAVPCTYGQAPQEPEGYRLKDYRAATPATLEGATVIDTGEAEALWRKGGAAFIDVLPQPERPANLPHRILWHPPSHESIPGAMWLPNVGFGEIAPETEAYFRNGLAVASHGASSHVLVFFCQRDCWMSWNAAKRALSYRYSAVYWYPEGTDGWKAAGLPLEKAEKGP